MVAETMQKVREAEKQAEDIVQDAQEQARQIVAKANQDAESLCAEALKKAKDDAKEMTDQSGADGRAYVATEVEKAQESKETREAVAKLWANH